MLKELPVNNLKQAHEYIISNGVSIIAKAKLDLESAESMLNEVDASNEELFNAVCDIYNSAKLRFEAVYALMKSNEYDPIFISEEDSKSITQQLWYWFWKPYKEFCDYAFGGVNREN